MAIVTPIGDGMGPPKETVDEWTKQIATEVPMKRFGQPEEVAPGLLNMPRTSPASR